MMLIIGGLCMPSGHGIAADAPSTQIEPVGQPSHAVAPSAAWNVPAEHLVHLFCPSSGLYVPGAQSVAFALPTEQLVPMSQTAQSASLVITCSIGCAVLPPGHGSDADDPCKQ